jgi:hypothetical protein
MIRLVAVGFVLTVATSALAMSPAPLHHPEGTITQVLTRAARVCTWSMGTAGRLLCAAKPGGVWCGVQGMFVASGVETLAPKISMR